MEQALHEAIARDEQAPFRDDDAMDDYDVRNSVDGCELCGGSGTLDPLPQLLELTDDKAADSEGLPRSSDPCDRWTGFPEAGWYYDALGYNSHANRECDEVSIYNPERLLRALSAGPNSAISFARGLKRASSRSLIGQASGDEECG